MKLKNTNELNWEEANILDYRYINHLTKMITERSVGIGWMPKSSVSQAWVQSYTNVFNFLWTPERFSPGGFITWEQISQIYSMTMFLATYVYMNENNFKEENFVNGDLRRHLGYSIEDLCNIADFDWFSNPCLPGQPIIYYSKFLHPLKKVLSSLKKVWSNRAYTSDRSPVCYGNYSSLPNSFYSSKNGVTVSGKDKYEELKDYDKIIEMIKETIYGSKYSSFKKSTSSGALYSFLTVSYIFGTWDSEYGSEESKYENFDTWFYSFYSVKNTGRFIWNSYFKPGSSYSTYLYSTTSFNNVPYTNSSKSYYHISKWGNIIKCGEGTVPEDGHIRESLQLPDWNLPNRNDLPDYIDLSEFFLSYSRLDGTSSSVKPGKKGINVGTCYIPLVIVDYSNSFQYN